MLAVAAGPRCPPTAGTVRRRRDPTTRRRSGRCAPPRRPVGRAGVPARGSAGEAAQQQVAEVGEGGAEAAGEDEEHESMPTPVARICHSHRQDPDHAAHVQRADEGAGDGAEAADHDHGEDDEALARGVGVDEQAVLVVHEQRARERGEEARHDERGEGGAAARHAVAAGGVLVLAYRHQHPPVRERRMAVTARNASARPVTHR